MTTASARCAGAKDNCLFKGSDEHVDKLCRLQQSDGATVGRVMIKFSWRPSGDSYVRIAQLGDGQDDFCRCLVQAARLATMQLVRPERELTRAEMNAAVNDVGMMLAGAFGSAMLIVECRCPICPPWLNASGKERNWGTRGSR